MKIWFWRGQKSEANIEFEFVQHKVLTRFRDTKIVGTA